MLASYQKKACKETKMKNKTLKQYRDRVRKFTGKSQEKSYI